MTRLKNITPSAVCLRMFNTSTPKVNFVDKPVILSLKPGEDVDEADWLVSVITDASYNKDIIDLYIKQGILSRISIG